VRGEVYTGLWLENLRERVHLKDPDVNGRIILKWKSRKWDGSSWTELIWLRIEKLVNAVMNFQFSQNGGNLLTYVELVSFPRGNLFHVVSK
jgi:hypothetical protein